jgi:DNA-binding NtrC family response regulator
MASAGPRILIVEDEENIVRIMIKALPKSWHVVGETDSRKALKRLLDGEKFDAIILDLIIPYLTGMTLFTELQDKKPELCEIVIFITGGRYIPAVDIFLHAHPEQQLVEKPFDIDEIKNAIAKVMAPKNGAEP